MQYLLLPLLGVVIGALGTLVGAGGGFILVPILLFLYPDDPPNVTSSISLAVVFMNATSGAVAYWRQRRIDLRGGAWFAIAAVPGSVLGALIVQHLSRELFSAVFGGVLIGIALLIFFRPSQRMPRTEPRPGETVRELTDRAGHHFIWAFSLWQGVVLAFGIGFLSSILGIGGGIIHVPMMVMLLSYPVHIATATSTFVLTVTSFAGTATHVVAGELTGVVGRTLLIGAGMVAGAQLGAALAPGVRPAMISRVLATCLVLVGGRLLLRAAGA